MSISFSPIAMFSRLTLPKDVVLRRDGLFVADFGNDRVRLLDQQASNVVADIGPGASTALFNPTKVAVDGDEILVVTSGLMLHRFDGKGKQIASTNLSSAGGLVHPIGLTVVPQNRAIVIADLITNKLAVLDADLNVMRLLGTGAVPGPNPGPATFYWPTDVVYEEDSNLGPLLYVADSGNKRVLRIAFEPDSSPSSVSRLSINTSNTDVFKGPPMFRPSAIAVDTAQNLIYSVDGVGGEIWMINMETGDVAPCYNNFGSGTGQLRNPQGLALIDSSTLAVADFHNNRIQIFEINEIN